MENGLEIGSKKFRQMNKIYSIEFIDNDEKLLIIGKSKDETSKSKLIILVWDIYYIDKVEEIKMDDFLQIKDLDTHLARASGNLLQVNYEGNVTSILSKINKQPKEDLYSDIELFRNLESSDNKHTIHFNHNINPTFKTIIDRKEPWIIKDYERNSFCLYSDDKETLQLIVGRSTVQIWHQIHPDPNDKDKKKKELSNKEEPFLEYIWANGIPVNQECELTRLRVEKFKYGKNNGLNSDFYLEVFWYEINLNKHNEEDNEEKIVKEEEEVIEEEIKRIEEIEEMVK
jgi:hypothetical protein